MVSYLTEELVRLGHDVTLFASGDSVTSAELVSCVPGALRLNAKVKDVIPYYMLMLNDVRRQNSRFDILHFHIDHLHFPVFDSLAGKTVTTLHGRQDLPDNFPLYAGFRDMPLISISDHQREPIRDANFVATIHHGLPLRTLAPVFNQSDGYLAFLGRIAPEKRPDRAIAIARAVGIRLIIAAKVDKVDEDYFNQVIHPLLGPGVDFIGEIAEHEKAAFLGGASALLFPIDWPEPFGLVMIEAMACGTPVLAFRHGSVPEIVDDDTGVIVESIEEAISAIPALLKLDRLRVRRRFEERFSVSKMALSHVDLYESLLRRASE